MSKTKKADMSEDLGIVIKSPEAALWTRVVKGIESAINQAEDELKVQKKFLETAKSELDSLESIK